MRLLIDSIARFLLSREVSCIKFNTEVKQSWENIGIDVECGTHFPKTFDIRILRL